MHVLAILAVPAIVLTNLVHAAEPPAPPPPRLLQVSGEERARIIAAQQRTAWNPATARSQ